MICKTVVTLVTDVFMITHSIQKISPLAHIDAVAPIKLIPSSSPAIDLNYESAWIGLANVKFRHLWERW